MCPSPPSTGVDMTQQLINSSTTQNPPLACVTTQPQPQFEFNATFVPEVCLNDVPYS